MESVITIMFSISLYISYVCTVYKLYINLIIYTCTILGMLCLKQVRVTSTVMYPTAHPCIYTPTHPTHPTPTLPTQTQALNEARLYWYCVNKSSWHSTLRHQSTLPFILYTLYVKIELHRNVDSNIPLERAFK